MSTTLFIAGLLAIVIAIVHSALGEILIFSRMRQGTVVPTSGQPLLRERHVRILWASWHLVSLLGLAFAALLLHSAYSGDGSFNAAFVHNTVFFVMAASALLVLIATLGKHPGWVGLLAVAVLVWMR